MSERNYIRIFVRNFGAIERINWKFFDFRHSSDSFSVSRLYEEYKDLIMLKER